MNRFKRYVLLLIPASVCFFLFQNFDNPKTILGNIDGLYQNNIGQTVLSGWTCLQGSTESLDVHIYAGAAYPEGQFSAYGVANVQSEPAVAQSCGTNGSAYRFAIVLDEKIKTQFFNEPIFVHAISKLGPQTVLNGSGKYLIPTAKNSTSCTVSNLFDLKTCMNHLIDHTKDFQILDFKADVYCSGNDCCGPRLEPNASPLPLIYFGDQKYKVILGNGHSIIRDHRSQGSPQCAALKIHNSSYTRVIGLNIDEDGNAPPNCSPYDDPKPECHSAVELFGASNVKFEKLGIYNAKTDSIHIDQTNQNGGSFVLTDSAISNSGIIGVYVGTYWTSGTTVYDQSSHNIFIKNSVIARTRTNAIAFQGVRGGAISNNIITGNHWHGLWCTDEKSLEQNRNNCNGTGDYVNGGQVYLPDFTDTKVINNIVANSWIENNPAHNVWGFEIGSATHRPLQNNEFFGNTILNISANSSAFFLNVGGDLQSNSSIHDNGLLTNNNSNPMTYYAASYDNHVDSKGSGIIDNGLGSATVYNNKKFSIYPSADFGGVSEYRIYRIRVIKTGLHLESNINDSAAQAGVVEGVFHLAMNPRSKANSQPIFRCISTENPNYDFPSFDRNCEGKGWLHSVFGYSFEPSFPGVKPLYRCAKNSYDNFVSLDSKCEGTTSKAFLGYAVVE